MLLGGSGLGSWEVARERPVASLAQGQKIGFYNGSKGLVSWFPAIWPPCGRASVISVQGLKGTGVFLQECRKASQRRQCGEGFSKARRHSYQENVVHSLVDFRDCAGC